MTRQILIVVAAALLAGCDTSVPGLGFPAGISTQGDGTDALGGLPDAEAAHASVEQQAPDAFVLTSNGATFVDALERTVRPLRQSLAQSLQNDATVTQGLANWETSSTSARLSVLKRVAALEGQVMGFTVPPLVSTSQPAPVAGMMAFYQPGDSDIGQVTIYGPAIAPGNKYLALSTLVHEMRHACQYQLVQADQNNALQATGDDHTLAQAYAGSWQAMDNLGGESSLAYGDYVHLDVEFDAFETGNEVAALVGGSQFNPAGSGFVDVQYQSDDTPVFDLVPLVPQFATADVVGAINQAEAQAQVAQSRRGTQIISQRHGGFTTNFGNLRGGRRGWGGF